MNKSKTILLTLAVLLGLTLSGLAQTPTGRPPLGPLQSHEKPRTVDELIAFAAAHTGKNDLVFRWDDRKNEQAILAWTDFISGDWSAKYIGGSSLNPGAGPVSQPIPSVRLEFRFSGGILRRTPDHFSLVFYDLSPGTIFIKTGDPLYIILDSKEQIQLECAPLDPAARRYIGVDQRITYFITREQLARITKAKKVEMRIGLNGSSRSVSRKILKSWKALEVVTQLEIEK